MRTIRKLIIAAILLMSPITARAAVSCDQFKAAISEGAAAYKMPTPKFDLARTDGNIQYFSITIFDDARALLSCWYGLVGTFAVDANSTEPVSILHTMLLAGIGLHGYGLDWRQALKTRDQLVETAKASDRQMSEVHVDGGKVSLVISVAGVPSFQIDGAH
jgi:hypothetical protein